MTMTNTFDVVVGLINLCGLFFVVNAFVIQPLKQVAREREEQARRRLDDAESVHAEALSLRERYQKLLAGLQAEKQSLEASAAADAEKLRARVAAEAEAEAKHTVGRAQTEARLQREAAVAEIRAQVAEETVQRARALLEKSLDNPARQDILDNFLEKVGAGHAG